MNGFGTLNEKKISRLMTDTETIQSVRGRDQGELERGCGFDSY